MEVNSLKVIAIVESIPSPLPPLNIFFQEKVKRLPLPPSNILEETPEPLTQLQWMTIPPRP